MDWNQITHLRRTMLLARWPSCRKISSPRRTTAGSCSRGRPNGGSGAAESSWRTTQNWKLMLWLLLLDLMGTRSSKLYFLSPSAVWSSTPLGTYHCTGNRKIYQNLLINIYINYVYFKIVSIWKNNLIIIFIKIRGGEKLKLCHQILKKK